MTSGLQDSTILGFPARAVSYEIGDVAGAKPCFPGNNAACLTWFATDTTLIIWPVGYRGTLFEIDVAGDPLLLNVRDRPNAAATAAGLIVGLDSGGETESAEVES